jgi:hypothetical protein
LDRWLHGEGASSRRLVLRNAMGTAEQTALENTAATTISYLLRKGNKMAQNSVSRETVDNLSYLLRKGNKMAQNSVSRETADNHVCVFIGFR